MVRRVSRLGSSPGTGWTYDARMGAIFSHEEKDSGVPYFPWIESWLVKVPGIQKISMVLWIIIPEYNNMVLYFIIPFFLNLTNQGPLFSLLKTDTRIFRLPFLG